jgi:dienelactone hydrolase
MVRNLIVSLMLYGLFSPVMAEIKGKEVTYRADDTELRGYLAWDDSIKGKRPGILVVHEWWGHNPYARKRAEMLAELGYTALAVDMYGDGKMASHPDDAGKFSSAVKKNMPVAKARFEAAMKLLQEQESVASEEMAAIGYCFGGGIVLEMARAGYDLDGVVSFHGSLGTASPAQKGRVKASVLVLNGKADPFVKHEQIETFKYEMQAAEVDYEFIDYPGAQHSFTNPDADKFGKEFGLPLAYSKEADEQSWQAMQDFFKKIFSE